MMVRAAVVLAALALAGCSLGPVPPASVSATMDATSTLPVPEATTQPVLVVTVTPLPTATPEPFVPFAVTTWADNVLLRANPGYLFDKLEIMRKGTSLQVVGRSPGGEWLLVQTSGNRLGWVLAQLVEAGANDLDRVPLVFPAGVLVVRGRVTDANGGPVSKIQFALVQGTGTDAPRTDAMTDETGVFQAFVPQETTGQWWLSYTAISCESNIMDSSCNWVGKPYPEGVYVDLPQGADTMLEFVWR